MTSIRISGRASISIRIGRVGRVRIVCRGGPGGAGDVEIAVGDGAGAIASSGAGDAGKRGALAGPGRAAGAARVTPAMEAAAIRSFLEGADTARLGRSLADAYLAMEAVRRTLDGLDDGD